jgi:hypothetical protein
MIKSEDYRGTVPSADVLMNVTKSPRSDRTSPPFRVLITASAVPENIYVSS